MILIRGAGVRLPNAQASGAAYSRRLAMMLREARGPKIGACTGHTHLDRVLLSILKARDRRLCPWSGNRSWPSHVPPRRHPPRPSTWFDIGKRGRRNWQLTHRRHAHSRNGVLRIRGRKFRRELIRCPSVDPLAEIRFPERHHQRGRAPATQPRMKTTHVQARSSAPRGSVFGASGACSRHRDRPAGRVGRWCPGSVPPKRSGRMLPDLRTCLSGLGHSLLP